MNVVTNMDAWWRLVASPSGYVRANTLAKRGNDFSQHVQVPPAEMAIQSRDRASDRHMGFTVRIVSPTTCIANILLNLR